MFLIMLSLTFPDKIMPIYAPTPMLRTLPMLHVTFDECLITGREPYESFPVLNEIMVAVEPEESTSSSMPEESTTTKPPCMKCSKYAKKVHLLSES